MSGEYGNLTPEQIVRLEALKIVSSMPKIQYKDIVEHAGKFEKFVLAKKPGRPKNSA